MKRFWVFLTIVCLLGMLGSPSGLAFAQRQIQEQTVCRVASVSDGDTVRLDDGSIVRLAGIDAPERNPEQFGARRASQRVKALLDGSGWQVCLEPVGKDRYGRYVADLRLQDGRSLCETLLREGLAMFYWHKELPDKMSRRLLAAQREALRQRAGSWEQILSLPMADEQYVGNRRSRRFFSLDCQDGKKISARNRQRLSTLEEALEQGFAPARQCGIWPLQSTITSRR